MDETDRSISPAMISSVIENEISMISAMLWIRNVMFPVVRKFSFWKLPTISVVTASTGTNRSHLKCDTRFICRSGGRSAARRSVTSRSALIATSSRAPLTACCQNSGIDSALSENPIERSSIAPSRAPMMVPEPPKMFTPPTTQAAITGSSKPVPAVASTPPRRDMKSTPAAPAQAPQIR